MSWKQRLPFLRWSLLRMALGMPEFIRTGQIGDGREEAAAAHVEAHARGGDVDHVLETIDEFAREQSMLMNTYRAAPLPRAWMRAGPDLAQRADGHQGVDLCGRHRRMA